MLSLVINYSDGNINISFFLLQEQSIKLFANRIVEIAITNLLANVTA